MRARLTLDQLAVTAGISRQTLFLAERAPHLMTERTARAVAVVLGVAIEELRR
jgi:DNA-binding XRE family transcriptional regulator